MSFQGDTKQPKEPALTFEVEDAASDDNDSKVDSDESDDGTFLFEDIKNELRFYEKQTMTSFQKLNLFFN